MIIYQKKVGLLETLKQYFDRLINVEPRAVVTKEAIPGLQKEIDKMIPHISDKLGIFLKREMKKL